MRKCQPILICLAFLFLFTACSKPGENIQSSAPVGGQQANQPDRELQTSASHSAFSDVIQDTMIPPDAKKYLSTRELNEINLFVTDDLKNVYNQYARTHDDDLLKNFSPLDVFRLYNQAVSDKNIEMQVALVNLPPDMGKNELINQIKNDHAGQENNQKIILEFRTFEGTVMERIVDNNIAYIIIGNLDRYRMEKNKQGVWKLGWLARQ